MKLMQRSSQSFYSRSLSTSSRCLTPSKSGQKSIKGINLTIKRNDDKKLPGTMDRTTTPVSPSITNSFLKHNFNHQLPSKQLFRKDSPFPKTYKDIRNKSLPAFNFDYHSFSELSDFSTVAQPYGRLFDNTTTQKKNSNALSQKYSPFTDTSASRATATNYNPVNFKSTVGQCLKFDSQSPNKRQIRTYTEPSIKASPISSQKFTQSKISQIYLDTPTKLNSNKKQSSTLKSLKNRIMTTSLQESTMKQNGQLKVDSALKNGFEFSLNIDPLQSKKQSSQQKIEKNVQNNQEKFNQQLKIIEQQRKNKQRVAFFDLSPKVSQQIDGSIYELTESSKKGWNFSPNWKLAQSQSIDLSFIKPVKRKLTLGQQDHVSQDLKESLILTQLLNSLKKNPVNQVKNKNSFNLELARKCSQNLCLVRNKQSGLMCGLIRTQKNEKFIASNSEFQGRKICIQKFIEFKNFILTEPFEYTLEQIFQMKLIEEKDIPGLIKRFHSTLNQIKQIARGKINLHKLKERIVYTHGSFRLIPLIEVL